ncbi:cation transporter [Neobacillus sp. MM2021_6]|uniref:heavy-metal-associated domain-containing protein n=1 Tax=Bacillaceae TaxID=186817 RepID=UPI0014077B72|nr:MULTISPECIES: heavy-metal-associated domain-containing protein [Bacillaceae]MBO0960641.1 cation transporter [Neobacillus sp. MM2021_6]NHC18363.1 cation transporter [Bacillus sp. MM2020_4]WML38418.1 heavy-metal-associated domain-containing protein [Neobacillus sp. OS1-2]
MSMIEIPLNDVACTGCIGKIKRQMQRTNGIEKVEIVSGTGKIQINFNESIIQSEEINRNLNKIILRTFD